MGNRQAGAPVGNRNAAHDKPATDALRRAIAQDEGKRLRGAVEKLLSLADAGEPWAVKELFDRTDGKPHQSTSTVLHSRRDARELSDAELMEIAQSGGLVVEQEEK